MPNMFVFISSLREQHLFCAFTPPFSVICLLLLVLLPLLLLFAEFHFTLFRFIFAKLLACYEFNEQNNAVVRVFHRYFCPFVSLFAAHLHELIIAFEWHVLRAVAAQQRKKIVYIIWSVWLILLFVSFFYFGVHFI